MPKFAGYLCSFSNFAFFSGKAFLSFRRTSIENNTFLYLVEIQKNWRQGPSYSFLSSFLALLSHSRLFSILLPFCESIWCKNRCSSSFFFKEEVLFFSWRRKWHKLQRDEGFIFFSVLLCLEFFIWRYWVLRTCIATPLGKKMVFKTSRDRCSSPYLVLLCI